MFSISRIFCCNVWKYSCHGERERERGNSRKYPAFSLLLVVYVPFMLSFLCLFCLFWLRSVSPAKSNIDTNTTALRNLQIFLLDRRNNSSIHIRFVSRLISISPFEAQQAASKWRHKIHARRRQIDLMRCTKKWMKKMSSQHTQRTFSMVVSSSHMDLCGISSMWR